MFGWMAFFIMGMVLGLIGGGGSILTVPILVYFFGMSAQAATGSSLFIVGSVAAVGAFASYLKKEIQFKKSLAFVLPSLAGVFCARSYFLPALPDPVFQMSTFELSKDVLLMALFAVLMLASSYKMIRANVVIRSSEAASVVGVVIQGFLIGAITGFIGAGGGFLIVPALVLLLNYGMKQAVGTSLLIIALNSYVGFLVDLLTSQRDAWSLLFWSTAIAILGLFLGRRLAPLFSEKTLKKAFGWFVLILGLIILIQQISSR